MPTLLYRRAALAKGVTRLAQLGRKTMLPKAVVEPSMTKLPGCLPISHPVGIEVLLCVYM